MKLYSYWRSTTSVRVRIALHLKGLAYDYEAVDLTTGAQSSDTYTALNPSKGVPCLVLDDGRILTQSQAILDYLDEVYPEPPLVFGSPEEKAQIRAAAYVIACDIHPVNNLKVLRYLKGPMGQSDDSVLSYMQHWMLEGFTAYQALIRPDTDFSFGARISLADLCLVGQMVNARRWGLDLAPFERLTDIDARCRSLDAVARALPDMQPDAPDALARTS